LRFLRPVSATSFRPTREIAGRNLNLATGARLHTNWPQSRTHPVRHQKTTRIDGRATPREGSTPVKRKRYLSALGVNTARAAAASSLCLHYSGTQERRLSCLFGASAVISTKAEALSRDDRMRDARVVRSAELPPANPQAAAAWRHPWRSSASSPPRPSPRSSRSCSMRTTKRRNGDRGTDGGTSMTGCGSHRISAKVRRLGPRNRLGIAAFGCGSRQGNCREFRYRCSAPGDQVQNFLS
jgi:hypothetical protein